MWQWLLGLLMVVSLALAGGAELLAAPKKSRAQQARVAETQIVRLARDIIGIFDSTNEATPAVTRLHRLLEMPLNHLGYRIVYWDIAKGVPPPDMTAKAYGFATWFNQPIPTAAEYFDWAAAAVRGGRRAIVIEQPGLLGASAELDAINALLGAIGIEYADFFVGDTAKTTVASSDPALIGFETQPSQLTHHVVRARAPDVLTHFVLSDPAHVWAKAESATIVATSPRGGFIAPGYATRFDPADQRLRWIVNPFAFLAASLGPTRFPIPDTTTLSGRRIYFSHIDGDAWNGRATLPGHPLDGRSSGDVILNDLIEPYTDLPVSVGLISSDIDPQHGGDRRAADTARRYFSLPHVEVASHTHTHPFDWGFFSTYDRVAELHRLVAAADRQPGYAAQDRSLAAVVRAAREQRLSPALLQPHAVYELPRSKVHQPFSIESEVQGALATSTRLAPPGKPARLYLWSGNTSPGEEFIRATRQAGVRNMNGGDPRYDSTYPSVSYLPAIGKPVGAERQIYATASNDYTYTNDWRGPFDGFARLSETLANTELPRRLKPFNIYYHMYSATRPEALAAVKQNLELARTSRIAPVTASTYAAIADAFYNVTFDEIGPQTWRVLNRGALQTLRFENPGNLIPDYAAGQGVIGHTFHAGALYVALDAAVPTVTLKLAASAPRKPKLSRPWLTDSRWQLSGIVAAPCRISGRAEGFGAGEMTWSGATPGRWRFDIPGVSTPIEAAAGPDGVLTLTLPGTAIAPIDFKARCY